MNMATLPRSSFRLLESQDADRLARDARLRRDAAAAIRAARLYESARRPALSRRLVEEARGWA